MRWVLAVHRLAVSSLCALALLSGGRPADALPCHSPEGSPTLGLVLSGGGARGLAHVGVLRALDEARIRPDCVAGTSMGAVVGSLYAAGHSVTHIEATLRAVDWARVFKGERDRSLLPPSLRRVEPEPLFRAGLQSGHFGLPTGALSDYRIARFLIRELAAAGFAAKDDFDRLPIPFRAVATNLATGEREVLAAGSLARAARASMSIPIAFAPVRWGNLLLVDGGLADNFPVGVARDMGADRVLGVDVRSPPLRGELDRDALRVALQLTSVLAQTQNERYAAPADLVVRPDLQGQSFTDYGSIDTLIEAGYAAARAALGAARQEGLSAAPCAPGETAADEAGTARLPGPALEGQTLVAVDVRGLQYGSAAWVRRTSRLAVGRPLKLAAALEAFDRLHATGLFGDLWLSFEPDPRGVRVVMQVDESDRWAVELGGGYNEADEAGAFARLVGQHLLGGTGRLAASFGATDAVSWVTVTLDRDRLGALPIAFSIEGGGVSDKPKVYRDDGTTVNRAEFDRGGVRVRLAADVGPLLAATEFELGSVRTRERAGLQFQPAEDSIRRAAADLTWDTLDRPFAPTRGAALRLHAERNLRTWGASRGYWRTWAKGRFLKRAGPTTVHLDLLAGLSGGAVPSYDLYRLGGPDLVPGRHRDEVWGRQAAAAALSLAGPVVRHLRFVIRVGAGGVWDERREITLSSLTVGGGAGLRLATPVGPLSIEWGRHGSGSVLYLGVGQPVLQRRALLR